MAGILSRSILSIALLAGALVGLSTSSAEAQTADGNGALQISWEVRNRFRLFREERDFLLHTDAGRGRSFWLPNRRWRCRATAWLGAQHCEPALHRSCRTRQRALQPRQRQGKLPDADRSPIVARLSGPVPVGATCAWSFDDGDGPQASTFDCAEPVNTRVR